MTLCCRSASSPFGECDALGISSSKKDDWFSGVIWRSISGSRTHLQLLNSSVTEVEWFWEVRSAICCGEQFSHFLQDFLTDVRRSEELFIESSRSDICFVHRCAHLIWEEYSEPLAGMFFGPTEHCQDLPMPCGDVYTRSTPFNLELIWNINPHFSLLLPFHDLLAKLIYGGGHTCHRGLDPALACCKVRACSVSSLNQLTFLQATMLELDSLLEFVKSTGGLSSSFQDNVEAWKNSQKNHNEKSMIVRNKLQEHCYYFEHLEPPSNPPWFLKGVYLGSTQQPAMS